MSSGSLADMENEAPSARSTIPSRYFGSDHDSTLLYLETRAVDHGGVPSFPNLRCDITRHPQFAHQATRLLGRCPPTRLMHDEELPDHDDWDCIEDMIAAGLIEWRRTGMNPVFWLTTAGWERAHHLRRVRAEASVKAAQ